MLSAASWVDVRNMNAVQNQDEFITTTWNHQHRTPRQGPFSQYDSTTAAFRCSREEEAISSDYVCRGGSGSIGNNSHISSCCSSGAFSPHNSLFDRGLSSSKSASSTAETGYQPIMTNCSDSVSGADHSPFSSSNRWVSLTDELAADQTYPLLALSAATSLKSGWPYYINYWASNESGSKKLSAKPTSPYCPIGDISNIWGQNTFGEAPLRPASTYGFAGNIEYAPPYAGHVQSAVDVVRSTCDDIESAAHHILHTPADNGEMTSNHSWWTSKLLQEHFRCHAAGTHGLTNATKSTSSTPVQSTRHREMFRRPSTAEYATCSSAVAEAPQLMPARADVMWNGEERRSAFVPTSRYNAAYQQSRLHSSFLVADTDIQTYVGVKSPPDQFDMANKLHFYYGQNVESHSEATSTHHHHLARGTSMISFPPTYGGSGIALETETSLVQSPNVGEVGSFNVPANLPLRSKTDRGGVNETRARVENADGYSMRPTVHDPRPSKITDASSGESKRLGGRCRGGKVPRPVFGERTSASGTRVYAMERPFACNWLFCTRRFTRSDELQRHFRTHTGDKRYVCPTCGKRFMRSDHLGKHRKTHRDVTTSTVSTGNCSSGTTVVNGSRCDVKNGIRSDAKRRNRDAGVHNGPGRSFLAKTNCGELYGDEISRSKQPMFFDKSSSGTRAIFNCIKSDVADRVRGVTVGSIVQGDLFHGGDDQRLIRGSNVAIIGNNAFVAVRG